MIKSKRWVAAILVVVLVATVVVAGLYFGHFLPSNNSGGSGTALAPNFSLTDIYGTNFTLSNYRSNSVVLVEFTALSCAECQIVEQSLKSLSTMYNESGNTHVQIISVFIEPQFGDTIPALKAYHAKNNVTWTMAQDTPSLSVSRSYGVSGIPNVIIVDKQGHSVYEVVGAQSTSQLQSTISASLAGTAKPISVVTVSVFALAALAGITTFFSPCAFPMFPGYMGLFLGLSAGKDDAAPTAASYKGAARRAVTAGSVTAIGMIVVFLAIGVLLILAASLVSGYIPYLLIIVGVILVGLGALLLTNLQYWRIVTPLQRLWLRLRGKEETITPIVAAAPTSGKGLNLKLFSYGMGYAAAAAGCVAPVIFSAIIAGLALGLVGGIINILIFSLTAAVLMIVVTLVLALAGKRYVNLLKAYTPLIKKVSAVALILVGFYLIYFYYTSWGF